MSLKFWKINEGFSLVETLFYVAIFAILTIVVINSMVTMVKSFKEVSIHREITQGGGEIMERISREIRGSKQINTLADVNGDLKLNTTDDGGNAKTIEFLLANNNLQIIDGQVTPLAIGDSFQGGKSAYILSAGDPGYIADGTTRGIISALSDQSVGGSLWGYSPCSTTNITGADSTALGTGRQNTQDMVAASCGSITNMINGVTINGYNDWYVPSKDELHKLFLNKTILGLSGGKLWSSSEASASNAYIESITYGQPTSDVCQKSNALPNVHAIRSFAINTSTFLNSPNVKVVSLTFNQLTVTKGQAIKVVLTISSKHDPLNRTYSFYDTVVLRGNY